MFKTHCVKLCGFFSFVVAFAVLGLVVSATADEIKTASEPAVILTPKPSPKPRLNGAQIFGVRPG